VCVLIVSFSVVVSVVVIQTQHTKHKKLDKQANV